MPKITPSITMFQSGDLVTWHPEKRLDLALIGLLRHGDGPFQVFRVIDLREATCDCQQTNGQHEDGCATGSAQSAGHAQHVTIETPTGFATITGAYLILTRVNPTPAVA